jgi:hypothetical protein
LEVRYIIVMRWDEEEEDWEEWLILICWVKFKKTKYTIT